VKLGARFAQITHKVDTDQLYTQYALPSSWLVKQKRKEEEKSMWGGVEWGPIWSDKGEGRIDQVGRVVLY